MSEHTPGPWTLENDSITVKAGGIRSARDRLLVVGISIPMSSGPAMEEGRANARLIAAAPDLLAALDALLQQSDEGPRGCFGADSGGTLDWKGSFHERLECGRRAIAKATGVP